MIDAESRKAKQSLSFGSLALNEGVFFVEGAKNGTLCDTNSGAVYSVNEVGCRVLRNETHSQDFWIALQGAGLASEIPNHYLLEVLDERISLFSLAFAWFELVSECNEMCMHCYAESSPVAKKKNPKRQIERLGYEDWARVILSCSELGCRAGQFIGGEPFMYRDDGKDVIDLAAYAKCIGYETVEIFTNGTLITPKRVQQIKDLNLQLAVSLYSVDENIHDAVTQTPGSCRRTVRALKSLKEADIPTRVETVVTRINQDTINETVNWVEQMGFSHRPPDVLRPTGRGENQLLLPDKETFVRAGLVTSPSFFAQGETFLRGMSRNSCLAGKIAITESGDVLPCIFSRDEVVGNVLKQSLGEITESEHLRQIWRSTKDDVLVCQDCEYRYVCFDCRPISQAANPGKGTFFSAPYPRCTYNPYIGEWGNGTWRLDDNEVPQYEPLQVR